MTQDFSTTSNVCTPRVEVVWVKFGDLKVNDPFWYKDRLCHKTGEGTFSSLLSFSERDEISLDELVLITSFVKQQ